jgi:hypothetical protein
MSEARVPRKVVVPPAARSAKAGPPPQLLAGGAEPPLGSAVETSAPPIPVWLVNGPFSDHDQKTYLAAAQRLGLDVTQWAKQILGRAVRGPLGTSTRQTRAPRRLKTLKRPFGHA